MFELNRIVALIDSGCQALNDHVIIIDSYSTFFRRVKNGHRAEVFRENWNRLHISLCM